MSKSRARFLSELLGTTGLVKKSKSALAGADEIIDLSTLPSIPNSKLTNSSITINSNATSLGGSVTLTTANVAEGYKSLLHRCSSRRSYRCSRYW